MSETKEKKEPIVLSEEEKISEQEKKGKGLKEEKDEIWYEVYPNTCSSYDSGEGVFEYEVHLPGVLREDIDLRVLPELFDLKARREHVLYTATEYFPYEVDVGSVEGKYENGLLRISGKFKDPLADAVEIHLE
ncbi:MAG: Hsp20/alpha crystallin family protein [Promethearchaeota archaeon]